MISAVILAAGESKRMGVPKMLLDIGGVSMLEAVISNVRKSSVDDITVVLGAYRDKLQKIVDNTGIRSCYNKDYKEGMLSSVQCGLRNINSRTIAVLVFQGDQPLIFKDVINIVINAFRKTEKGIVVPVYNNRRGHPLLFSKKYFKNVKKLDTDKGLRALLEIFAPDVEEVSVKEAGILRDFDTFDQYNEAFNKI